MKFFALSSKEAEWSESGHKIYIPYSGTLQWVISANAVSRPQLLDVLNSSVGTEQLIYLYAKVRCVYTFPFSNGPMMGVRAHIVQ